MVTPKISTKTYKLNTGALIPAIGLGTWQSPEDECFNAVLSALQNGYKHIDTARVYQNEEAVGKAINQYLKESNTPRSEIFVTTKLWCSESQNAEKAIRESLKRLQLDYVDLYLTHWPVTMASGELFPKNSDGSAALLPYDKWSYVDTYKAMQKLVPLGLTKAIGISNFNIPKIENLLSDPEVNIVPACNQIELHPYLPQFELVEFCKSKGILCEAYSPLGSTGAPLLQEEKLIKLAKKYNVSPACIAISWAVARDTVVLPKSVTPSRVVSNLQIIELTPEDLFEINGISEKTTKRVVSPKWDVDVFNSGARF